MDCLTIARLTYVTLLIGVVPAVIPAARAQELLPIDQIVERMQRHEESQSKELEHYESVRHYEVQYQGFGKRIMAKMDVDLNFDRVSGKSFRILSQSGSKLLCDKVLKRAVESEEEASKDRGSTALSPANYRFQLVRTDKIQGRPAYVLEVDPRKKNKFLYRGRVWVDVVDFAVVKIEVEPAQNPSFWISSTRIENTNSKTDGIWLPQKNRSESKIRIGGTALLTIDYGTYQVLLSGSPEVSTASPASAGSVSRGAAF
jgi:hypothetical protein